MQVKAQGLLNAAKYIEDEYGRDALGEVVRACSEPVRERYIAAIAINWHPMEEFVEFVEKADKMLGRGNLKLAEEVGAAGARANMKGTVIRIAVYIAKPEFFFRRVAGLWRQFNDEGEMLVHNLDEHAGTMEVRGVSTPHPVFCAVLSGWMREVATGIGIQNPHVRHRQCRTRGDAQCIWEARWTSIEAPKAASEGKVRAQARPPSMPPSSGTLPPASGSLPGAPPASSATVRAAQAPPRSSRGAIRVPSKPPPKDKGRGKG